VRDRLVQAAAAALAGGLATPLVVGEAPPAELLPVPTDATGAGAAPTPSTGEGGAGLACGCRWQLPAGCALAECALVWVGAPSPALLRLLMALPLTPAGSPVPCARYCPATRAWEAPAAQAQEAARLLKRRYYLVERARSATLVGLVAGTLGVAGVREALLRTRALAAAAGKRTYTLLVGKPNPAKLANFPEMDVFVLIACPFTALLDSRDFHAPIITAHEAAIAFTPGAQWLPGAYSAELDTAAPPPPAAVAEEAAGGQLLVRGERGLQSQGSAGEVTSAAEYLHLRRSFQGLQPGSRAEGDVPAGAQPGAFGRASAYSGEGDS